MPGASIHFKGPGARKVPIDTSNMPLKFLRGAVGRFKLPSYNALNTNTDSSKHLNTSLQLYILILKNVYLFIVKGDFEGGETV